MAKIVLYQDVNFGGNHIVIEAADANLIDQGWNDRVSSIVVVSGNWVLYRDVNYSGPAWYANECGGLWGKGVYPTPSSWGGANDAISSLRPS